MHRQLNGKRGQDYGKPVLSQHCPRNGKSLGDSVRYQPLYIIKKLVCLVIYTRFNNNRTVGAMGIIYAYIKFSFYRSGWPSSR